MPLFVDLSRLPELRLQYVGEYTDAELGVFLEQLDGVLRLQGRKVCVIDLTQAQPPTARQRQLQAAWIGKNEPVLASAFAAAAIVTDSAIIRGTVTAVFWIRPLPFPTRVAATLAGAEAWLAPFRASLAG